MTTKIPIEDRFWQKVNKSESCWEWTGSLNTHGYGQLHQRNPNKNVAVHRFSYELHNGQIPHGLYICHVCDNRRCVNPEHLWAGTSKDNIRDCKSKGRFHKGNQYSKK